MKKSRYTEEQIVGILRETDRDPVATAPRPVATPSLKGQSSEQETPVLSS